MLTFMYALSTDAFSSDTTMGLLSILSRWLGRDPRWPNLGETNHWLRKAMHVIEYALLAGLVFRALRAANPIRWKLSWCVYAFLAIVAWSVFDEYHQTFTQTRSGTLGDVLLDSAGGFIALLAITLYFHLQRPSADSGS